MKRTISLAALAIALMLPTAVKSADLGGEKKAGEEPMKFVEPASSQWTGVYLGVQGGYGFGQLDGQPTYDPGTGPVTSFFDPGKIEIKGALGGVTVGAQRQWGSFVLGLEADGSWGDLKGDQTFDARGLSTGYHWQIEPTVDGLYTARLRAGMVMGSMLVYGTGGIAAAQVSMDETVTADKVQGFPNDGTVTARASSDENMLGWVAGGGVEWQFAQGWTFKTEALYVELGEVEHRFKGVAYPGTLDLPHTTDSYNADLGVTIVRAGVNVRF